MYIRSSQHQRFTRLSEHTALGIPQDPVRHFVATTTAAIITALGIGSAATVSALASKHGADAQAQATEAGVAAQTKANEASLAEQRHQDDLAQTRFESTQAENKRQFDETQARNKAIWDAREARLAPFRASASAASTKLSSLLGLAATDTGAVSPTYQPSATFTDTPYMQGATPTAATGTPNSVNGTTMGALANTSPTALAAASSPTTTTMGSLRSPGGWAPKAAGAGGGQIQVTDPLGGIHTFPDQASANRFKQLAGMA